MLEKLGYRVDVAPDGRQAVEMYETISYDLVFMDCQMPEMDGYEATGEIRKLSGPKSEVPIIAMTANAMPGDREKCMDAGMNDYMAKPIQLVELEKVCEQWISGGAGVSAKNNSTRGL